MSARRLPVALAIVALVLGAGSCGGGGEDESPAGSTAPGDLVVGDLVPLRGDLAPFGPAARKAADLAARGVSDAAALWNNMLSSAPRSGRSSASGAPISSRPS